MKRNKDKGSIHNTLIDDKFKEMRDTVSSNEYRKISNAWDICTGTKFESSYEAIKYIEKVKIMFMGLNPTYNKRLI